MLSGQRAEWGIWKTSGGGSSQEEVRSGWVSQRALSGCDQARRVIPQPIETKDASKVGHHRHLTPYCPCMSEHHSRTLLEARGSYERVSFSCRDTVANIIVDWDLVILNHFKQNKGHVISLHIPSLGSELWFWWTSVRPPPIHFALKSPFGFSSIWFSILTAGFALLTSWGFWTLSSLILCCYLICKSSILSWPNWVEEKGQEKAG